MSNEEIETKSGIESKTEKEWRTKSFILSVTMYNDKREVIHK